MIRPSASRRWTPFTAALAAIPIADTEALMRLAPELRVQAPFGWCVGATNVRAITPEIRCADFRLGDLERAGLLSPEACAEFRAQSHHEEVGWTMYVHEGRLGPITSGAALARASDLVVLLHGLRRAMGTLVARAPAFDRLLPEMLAECQKELARMPSWLLARLVETHANAKPAPAAQLRRCAILLGADDPMATADQVTALLTAHGVPRELIQIVTGSGHYPHADNNVSPEARGRNTDDITRCIDVRLATSREGTPLSTRMESTALGSDDASGPRPRPIAVAFSPRLEQVPGGGPYYVSIPANVSQAIGRRGIVPIIASVNGVAEVHASMIPCGGGRHRLRLNAATRDAADAKLGGRLSVRLQVDDNPVAEPVPADLVGALREVAALDAFRRMPVGRQNHILRWLDAAVREVTREKRVAQIVEGALAWREDPKDRRWEGAGRG